MVTELLRVAGLRLSRSERAVLRGVSLSVAPGEFCALMGLSGSGKTTVLRAAVALEGFQSGSIDVGGFGLEPGPLPPQSKLGPLRRKVGMVFQAHALFEHLTALDNVALAPVRALGHDRRAMEGRARELLDSLGVGARASAYPRELSGGEAQRVAIARALAVDPPLLLMDEPTAALDPARRGSLGEALKRLAAGERGLLVATHDTDFARDFADRVVILAEGIVAQEGKPEILTNPSNPATRALLEYRAPRQ
jgi:ABC-type polar amino acid transport system ATPase subunit